MDYHTFKLDKERLIMYAHLSQQQPSHSSKLLIEKTLGDKISAVNSKMETTIGTMIKQNQEVIMNMLVESTKNITEFDVHDMKDLITSHKDALADALEIHAVLVTQNSVLRMHLSFMRVEYRDFVTKMQKNNKPQYRDQRRNPKLR
jgi:hypothetical protein